MAAAGTQAAAAALDHVFRPITLNKLAVRNRIFVPAHTTVYGMNNLPTERHLEYHRARARGGVGAIIFEAIRTHPSSVPNAVMVDGTNPAFLAPFRAIARAVQAEGAKLIGQIIHVGRHSDGDYLRSALWGASTQRWSPTAPQQHQMNRDDMDAVIAGHVCAAQNVVEAGADGVEVHFGHGHLLQEYLSTLSNTRTDDYGGSEENRLRFPLEVLAAVRKALGPDACIGIRFSAEEYTPGGIDLPMAQSMTPKIAAAVPIDFIHVSHSAYYVSPGLATQMADMAIDPAPFRLLPAGVRQALRAAGHTVPVLTVCKYRTLQDAEDMLAAGNADMVGMARAHIADPEIVRKTREGRAEEIRPCIGCNQGCAGMLDRRQPITCLVNPAAGKEGKWRDPRHEPAAKPRHIAVVGGGPAGMEAAWVAAARGHRVTLLEREQRLGGQINWMRTMPRRQDFLKLLDYQEGQLRRHQVSVRLGVAADLSVLDDIKADEVVVATGSTRQPVRFRDGSEALTMEQALTDPGALGSHVVFYDLLGEWSTLSVIEHLADLGKRMTVVCPSGQFAWRTAIYSNLANRARLRERKARLVLLHDIQGFSRGGIDLIDLSTGDGLRLDGVDSVVGVQPNRADDVLFHRLRTDDRPAHLVGDSVAPRTALEAVYEGHELARNF